MKRITKQETLPALAVPEVLSVPELTYPARLGKRAVVHSVPFSVCIEWFVSKK